jgi:hypothetical protein
MTKFHMGYYNTGFNISETGEADYRLYIKEGGNVGIGTSDPLKKLHVNGDLKVADTVFAGALSPDIVNADNIVDEVGIAGASSGALDPVATAWGSHVSCEITVPSGGYVLALGDAHLIAHHGISGISEIWLAISEYPDALSWTGAQRFYLYSNVSAGTYGLSVSCQRVFSVPTAGTYTFYMIAMRDADNDASIYGKQMELIYIPTSYASKDGEMITDRQDNIYIAPADDDRSTEFVRTGQADRGVAKFLHGNDIAALAGRIELLTAKVEALESRLQAVENE